MGSQLIVFLQNNFISSQCSRV